MQSDTKLAINVDTEINYRALCCILTAHNSNHLIYNGLADNHTLDTQSIRHRGVNNFGCWQKQGERNIHVHCPMYCMCSSWILKCFVQKYTTTQRVCSQWLKKDRESHHFASKGAPIFILLLYWNAQFCHEAAFISDSCNIDLVKPRIAGHKSQGGDWDQI